MKRKSPPTTQSKRPARKKPIRNAQEATPDEFGRQFNLPTEREKRLLDQDRLKQRKKNRPHECCLGEKCIMPMAPQKHKCRQAKCLEMIHHVCADANGLWKGDEMNVFCSKLCM